MTRAEYFLARAEWHEAEARELRRMAELEKFSSSMDGFKTQPNYDEFKIKVLGPRKPSPSDASNAEILQRMWGMKPMTGDPTNDQTYPVDEGSVA